MTDKTLCDAVNEGLPEGWEPFEPLGNGEDIQGYRKAGDYGVVGHEGNWVIVHALDAVPATDLECPTLEHAISGAETLAARDELTR